MGQSSARGFRSLLALVGALTMAWASPAGAINGGDRAPLQSYPFMVSLIDHAAPAGQEARYHFCGGTLIAKEWVLTAANCVYLLMRLQSPEEIDIYVGSIDFMRGDRIRAAQFVVHPQYDRVRGENDIALVRLARAPQTNLPVAPATVTIATDPKLEDSAATRPVTVIGWGPMDYAASANSVYLQAVNLQLQWAVMTCPFDQVALAARWTDVKKVLRQLRLSQATEDELYRLVAAATPPLIPPHSLCTGRRDSPSQMLNLLGGPPGHSPLRPGPCASDAGGPMLGKDPDGSLVQLGIVSFPFGYEAQPCDSDMFPPYYVSVGAFADWIAAVIGNR